MPQSSLIFEGPAKSCLGRHCWDPSEKVYQLYLIQVGVPQRLLGAYELPKQSVQARSIMLTVHLYHQILT